MTCTDCGIPIIARPKAKGAPPPPDGTRWHGGHGRCTVCASRARRQAPPRKRQRSCNVALALQGKCKCTMCRLARDDRESPMDAGFSVPERHGIRKWIV